MQGRPEYHPLCETHIFGIGGGLIFNRDTLCVYQSIIKTDGRDGCMTLLQTWLKSILCLVYFATIKDSSQNIPLCFLLDVLCVRVCVCVHIFIPYSFHVFVCAPLNLIRVAWVCTGGSCI